MRWVIPRVIVGVLLAYVGFRFAALIGTRHVEALWLKDYALYMGATHRWLGGGEFYPASQLAGPWTLEWGSILYPPVTLALFVPFALLPPTLAAFLWLTIPAGVAACVVWSWRPSTWGWVAILALISTDTLGMLSWTAGTPTTWYVAVAALSTRVPWVSAFILTKPTLLPFGLVGVRDRRWWYVLAALAAGSYMMAGDTAQWVQMTLAMTNADPLYSLPNFAWLLIPWVARQTSRTPLMPMAKLTGLLKVPRAYMPSKSPVPPWTN